MKDTLTAGSHFLLLALVFGLAYCQAPLYYSNQNQYFLQGLADAGLGSLDDDWLAQTTDPTPVFSGLVSLTYRFLHEYAFHVYYFLFFGIYALSMLGLFSHLAGERGTPRLKLAFFALFLLVHSALVRWASYQYLAWDYPWYVQAGLANQYILGAMFQPSVFGVLLVLALYLFVQDRPFWAVTCLALAGTLHATYLLASAMLTLGFMLALWRDGKGRVALGVGGLALVLVLPAVVYSAMMFHATSPEAFAEAQHILVYERIPHHCLPRLWCDEIAVGQIAWMLLAIALTWGTRLFIPLSVMFLLSAALTGLQVATESDTLALLFPWRSSAVLVPVATTVILTRLVLAAISWFDRLEVAFGGVVVVAGLMLAGLAITWYREGFQTNPDEAPLLEFVKANRADGHRYLLPVSKPNLIANTRGARSSDFEPMSLKKRDRGIIPVDLQQFRLGTGAPIFVDFKAIPYRDTDVLEWRRRLELNRKLYAHIRAGELDSVRSDLEHHRITHVVMPTGATVDHLEWKLEFSGVNRIYRVTYVKPSASR